eukprot:5109578-Pyramimonas_sp.AAC.1
MSLMVGAASLFLARRVNSERDLGDVIDNVPRDAHALPVELGLLGAQRMLIVLLQQLRHDG